MRPAMGREGGALVVLGDLGARLEALEAEGAEKDRAIRVLGLVKTALVGRFGAWGREHAAGLSPAAHAELAAILRDCDGGDLAPAGACESHGGLSAGKGARDGKTVDAETEYAEKKELQNALEACFELLQTTEASLGGLVGEAEGWREGPVSEMADIEARLADLETRAADVTGVLLASVAERDNIIEGMTVELEKDADTLHRAQDVIAEMEEADHAEHAIAAAGAVPHVGGADRPGHNLVDASASCPGPELKSIAVGPDADSALEVELLRDKLDDAQRLITDLESQLRRHDEELVRLKLENDTLNHNTEMGHVSILTAEAEKSELEGEIAHLRGVCSEVIRDTAALLSPEASTPQTPPQGSNIPDCDTGEVEAALNQTSQKCQEKLRTSVSALHKKYSDAVLESQLFSDKCQALQRALEGKSSESMGLAGELAALKVTMDSQAQLSDELVRDLEESRRSAVREVSLKLAGREREVSELKGELQGVQEQVSAIVEYHTSGEGFVGAQKQLDTAYIELCHMSDALVHLETLATEATAARTRAEGEAGEAKTQLSLESTKCARLEDDVETLRTKLSKAEAKSGDFENRVKSLKGENSSLWSSLNQSRERNRALVVRLQEGEDRVLSLSKTNETLRIDISKSEKATADATSEFQCTQEKLLAHQAELEEISRVAQAEAEESMGRLRSEIECLQTAATEAAQIQAAEEGRLRAEIESHKLQIQEFEALTETLRAKNASLRFSNSSAEADRAELENERGKDLERIKELLSENASLQQSIDGVRGEELQVQNELRARLVEAEAVMGDLKSAAESLREEKAELQKREALFESEKCAAAEKLADEQARAEEQVAKLNSEIQKHKAQIVEFEVCASVAAAEKAELQGRLDSLSEVTSRGVEQQEAAVEGLRAKNASLQFLLSSAEAEHNTAMEALRGELEQIKTSDDERAAVLVAHSGELEALREENMALADSVEKLCVEREELEVEARELRSNLQEREREAARQSEVDDLLKKNEEMGSEIVQLTAEVAKVRKAHARQLAKLEAEKEANESRILAASADLVAAEKRTAKSESARGDIVKRAVEAERGRAEAVDRAQMAEKLTCEAEERAARAEQALSAAEERAASAAQALGAVKGTSAATEEKAASLERQAEVVGARKAYADTLLDSSLEMTANMEVCMGDWEKQLTESLLRYETSMQKIFEGHAREFADSDSELGAILDRLDDLSLTVFELSLPASPAQPSPREDLMQLARTLAESNFEKTLNEVKRVLETALGALGPDGPIPVKEKWRLTAALSNLETQLRQSQKSASRIVRGFPIGQELTRSTSLEPVRARRRSQTVHTLP